MGWKAGGHAATVSGVEVDSFEETEDLHCYTIAPAPLGIDPNIIKQQLSGVLRSTDTTGRLIF